MGPRSSARTPIGLQIRDEALQALQFQPNGKGLRLNASARVAWADANERSPGDTIQAFRQLTEDAPWSGRQAVITLPASEVDIRPVRLPEGVVVDGSPRFNAALMAEARVVLLYDPREAVVACLPLPLREEERDGRAHVLLIATRKVCVNRYLSAMSRVGLRCLCVDIAPCAAVRALARRDENTLLVDLHEDFTQVSVYNHGEVLFSRVVKYGLGSILDRLTVETGLDRPACEALLRQVGIDHIATRSFDLEIAETAGIPRGTMAAMVYEAAHVEWQQLTHEIQRTADYFALQPFGATIEGVSIIGDTVPIGLDRLIESRMQIPVAAGALDAACQSAADEAGRGSTVAAGLALRKVKRVRGS